MFREKTHAIYFLAKEVAGICLKQLDQNNGSVLQNTYFVCVCVCVCVCVTTALNYLFCLPVM